MNLKNNTDIKKRAKIIIIFLFLFCIVAALVIFFVTNKDIIRNKPTPSNTQVVNPSNTNTNNPTAQPTNSEEPAPTREPSIINISYEYNSLIIEDFTGEYDFSTVFSNDKHYVSDALRYPEDTKTRSWYEVNNKSTINFELQLDEYNIYELDNKTITPANSQIEKIEIKKVDNVLYITCFTDQCLAVTNISSNDKSIKFFIDEFKNFEFFNYSNEFSRKFFYIPEYQICMQSDSDVLYYEDNISGGSDGLYTIRLPEKGRSMILQATKNFPLKEETIYIKDGYIEFLKIEKQVISGVTFYDISMKLEKELILYPNSNTYYSTITFCDPNSENLIVIDAGHGGHDPGTESRLQDKYNESKINLNICLEIEKILLEQGYNVYMTRNEDIYLGFALERGDIANYNNAKVFLSVHVNSYEPSTEPHGVTSIYRYPEEKDIAQIIQDNVMEQVDAPDRGLMYQELAIHKRTVCPAVTVEVGFMTNPEESAKLKSTEYQHELAKGIANGLIEYLNQVNE